MLKSPNTPITPNTPSSKKRFLIKMFSRQNLKKEKERNAVPPLHISVPLPQSPPHFNLPRRDLTSLDNFNDKKVPPKLRVNVQLERVSKTEPCTAVIEQFPNHSDTKSRGPLPSVRSWHNLREKKVQNTTSNMNTRTRKLSKPRPKKFMNDPEALQMYLQNTQSTPVGNDRPINASPRNLTRDKESPIIDLLPNLSSDDDESIQSTTSEIKLDDYPWYFVEGVDNEQVLYGLSPISFCHVEDLEGK